MSSVAEESISMPALTRGTNGGMKNTDSNSTSGEEVRTLFVSGLPMDVRLRELYLLFRSYEGYEGSFLKLISSKPGKIPQPIAFVSFVTRKQAEKALEELQGVRFDPASAQTLRLEFARTNSRVSPKQQSYISHSSPPMPSIRNGQLSKGSPPYIGGTSPAVSPSGQNLMTLADCWSSMGMNGMASPVPYNSGAPPLSPDSSTAHLSVLSILSDSESSTYPTPASTPDKVEESTPKQSSTLAVGNLDQRVKEEDVNSVFDSCSGFVKVNLCTEDNASLRSPEAIVEFKDPECAKTAMEKYQGCRFDWTTGDGIRIEYDSRNPSSTVVFSPSPAMDTSVSPSLSYPPPYNTFQHSSYHTNVQQPMLHMLPKDVNDALTYSPVLSPANPMEHYANPSPLMYSGPVFMH